ncbi:MAG TPA: class I fructose-bisphosphate aldolase [Bauldia sp.]|nr:class I fructose-bisphosphate aldolase [Bauldia sp.]
MAERLEDIAERLVAPGKGILAADESNATCTKRFEALGIPSTPDTRRDYRELFFRADEAMRNFVSGVILYDETIRQNAKDGTPLSKVISNNGSIPGIKVDTGTKPLALQPGEVVTEGLDGLRDRLKEYYGLGARFAKWRAVINIGPGMPSNNAIHANAHALARYAALCQEAMIVPIVEPEVLMDGSPATHDADTCYAATEKALRAVFDELKIANVNLRGIVLKPSMVVAGKNSPKQISAKQVAEKTVQLLKAVVPAEVPGIAFLSGGQSDQQATEHLSLMNQAGKLPWRLTFSYGRALQAPAIKAWAGKSENVAAAQKAFLHRVRMNSLAASGRWAPDLEKQAA